VSATLATTARSSEFNASSDLRTKLKLKRLAHYYGCSVTTLIENLAADAEEVIVREIASRDIGDYYSAKLQCTSPLRPVAAFASPNALIADSP